VTWLRWDTDAAFSDVVGDLVSDLRLHPAQAFGHYVATCLGFGKHRPDGLVTAVADPTLEGWARWTGKPGKWAAAFRVRCADEGGLIRGWWRNSALLEKQEKDRRKRKPPKNPPETPEGFSGKPPETLADDGGRRTEDGNEDELLPTTLPGRLAEKLIGHPARYAIVDFLDAVPADQRLETWSMALNGCLEGLGTEQNRRATVEELAAACNDYLAAKPEKWGLPHFRSFVDRVMAKRFRPQRSSEVRLPRPTATDRAVAAAKAFAEGGTA